RAAPVGVHCAAAAVRPGDRVHDREPEADAAVRAAARLVGARETLEDPTEGVGWNAATLVLDLDHEVGASTGGANLDPRACGRVLDRVLEQRVERDPQRLGIGAQSTRGELAEPPRAR